MAAAGVDDIPVTAEDQQMINKFARLHNSFVTLNDEMKSLLTDVQNLSEASDEVMLLGDEEGIPLKLGSTFIHFSQEDMSERLEKMKAESERSLEERNREKEVIEAEMKRLKTFLYSKFGDKINLEAESND